MVLCVCSIGRAREVSPAQPHKLTRVGGCWLLLVCALSSMGQRGSIQGFVAGVVFWVLISIFTGY